MQERNRYVIIHAPIIVMADSVEKAKKVAADFLDEEIYDAYEI